MSDDAAIREWAPLAYWIARDFYLPGSDRDDVRQEALIAAWFAVRDFDGTGNLRGFVASCVRRRLGSALRDARRLLERRAVIGVACGMAYAELGSSRSVDNALCRARRKLAGAA